MDKVYVYRLCSDYLRRCRFCQFAAYSDVELIIRYFKRLLNNVREK